MLEAILLLSLKRGALHPVRLPVHLGFRAKSCGGSQRLNAVLRDIS